MAFRNRQERKLLQQLLDLTDQVEIRGLAICMITAEGEVLDCTGKFVQDSHERLIASLRLSKHLNEIAGA